MRKIELTYVEVMNETEQLFIFSTTFNKRVYSHYVIVNTVRNTLVQDYEIATCIQALQTMKKANAKDAS